MPLHSCRKMFDIDDLIPLSHVLSNAIDCKSAAKIGGQERYDNDNDDDR